MLVHKREEAAQQPDDGQPVLPGRSRAVTVAALTLMAIQLIWMTALLTHTFFRQDDYFYLYRGFRSGMGWHYLMWEDAGQLMPFGMALFWVLAKLSLYNWPLAALSIIALWAATSLALLRVLRTLFGNRPEILVLLALFLFSPLEIAGVSWWSWALIILPVELAVCMAVDAHVRYLRGGRMRNAVAAGGWLVVGMAASDKGAVVPLALFALTWAFFVAGPLASSAVAAAVRYWRAWLLYGAVLAAWAAVYVSQMSGSSVRPHNPGPVSNVVDYVSTATGTTLLPSAMGGPWRWSTLGYSMVNPPAALQQLSWAVAAIVVVVSCARRVHAWRAWAILAGWLVTADILPVVLGRLGATVPASLIALQARYLADAVPLLAICTGLAFLPLAQEHDAIRLRLPSIRPVAFIVLGVYLAGSFWSLQSFESQNNAGATAARSYIATARVAVADAPRGTLIVDGATPPWIVAHWIFGPYSYTSQVIGPIAHGEPAKHLLWTAAPRGVPGNLMMFNTEGQLRPAVVAGPLSGPPVKAPGKAARPRCWGVTSAGTSIPVRGSLYRWAWFVRLDYSGPATAAAVSYGGTWVDVALPAGTHAYYVPVVGGGSAVSVRLAGPAPGWCLSGLAVGSMQPAASGPAIPAAPVDG